MQSSRSGNTSTLTSQLFQAIKNNKINNVVFLIKQGANLAQTHDEKTPMQYARELATSTGNWSCVQAIATTKNADQGDSYKYGDALVVALSYNQFSVATSLVKANALLSYHTINNEYYPLHYAVNKNDIELLKLLITHGASLANRNKNQETPIQLAAKLGHWGCVQAIVKTKTDETDSYQYGDALLAAIQVKRPVSEIESLVQAGADLTVKNKNNYTSIQLAAHLGYWNSVQILIESKTINKERSILFNVLLHAITQSNYAMTKLLLDYGADCNQWDSECGNIALYWAVTHNEKNPDIISLLLEYKSDPAIRNGAAETVEDLAKKLGHSACLQRLKIFQKNIHMSTLGILELRPDSNDSLEQLRYKANFLYQTISENALKAEDLPFAIKKLHGLHKVILEKNKNNLLEYRNELQSTSSSQTNYLTQSLNTDSKLGRLKAVIQVINTLLNYPDQPVQLSFALNPNSPEENDIQIYFSHKKDIDDYILRLHIFLSDIKIKVTNWKMPNFLGIWVESKPEPIQKIYDLLENLPKIANTDTTLDFYEQVMLLMEIEQKDKKINEFYKDSISKMIAMTFIPTYTIENNLSTEDPNQHLRLLELQPVDPPPPLPTLEKGILFFPEPNPRGTTSTNDDGYYPLFPNPN